MACSTKKVPGVPGIHFRVLVIDLRVLVIDF